MECLQVERKAVSRAVRHVFNALLSPGRPIAGVCAGEPSFGATARILPRSTKHGNIMKTDFARTLLIVGLVGELLVCGR